MPIELSTSGRYAYITPSGLHNDTINNNTNAINSWGFGEEITIGNMEIGRARKILKNL